LLDCVVSIFSRRNRSLTLSRLPIGSAGFLCSAKGLRMTLQTASLVSPRSIPCDHGGRVRRTNKKSPHFRLASSRGRVEFASPQRRVFWFYKHKAGTRGKLGPAFASPAKFDLSCKHHANMSAGTVDIAWTALPRRHLRVKHLAPAATRQHNKGGFKSRRPDDQNSYAAGARRGTSARICSSFSRLALSSS
jgi:hypothetical protein